MTPAARAVSGIALAAALSACEGSAGPETAPSAFDGQRAWADLVSQVRIGPRPAGSEGSLRVRRLISDRLRQAGWRVEPQRFEARLPDGAEIPMTNLIARLEGESPGRILLGTHFDTKRIADAPDFAGANDGASGVAVLLELARQLRQRPRAWSYTLLFFDGEEALGERITQRDGLYGSRALAARMRDSGEFERVRAFVLIDMVGDSDLNLQISADSAGWLASLWREAAAKLGRGELTDPDPVRLVDDHTPFVRLGLEPVLALIDFQFGARWTPGPFWHTAADDLRSVSAESLNSVGEILVQFLVELEAHLEAGRDANSRR